MSDGNQPSCIPDRSGAGKLPIIADKKVLLVFREKSFHNSEKWALKPCFIKRIQESRFAHFIKGLRYV